MLPSYSIPRAIRGICEGARCQGLEGVRNKKAENLIVSALQASTLSQVPALTSEWNPADVELPASDWTSLPAALLQECCVRHLDRPCPYRHEPDPAWYRPHSWSRARAQRAPS